MLPEELSNELCSLKPEVDRLVMVCEMEVAAERRGARRTSSTRRDPLARAPHLHARGRRARGQGGRAAGADEARPARSRTSTSSSRRCWARAPKRGAIDFDSVETQMIFDEHGKIERIVRVQRNDAHRLIEECMLAANVCASDFLDRATSSRRSTASTRAPRRRSSRRCARCSRTSASRWAAATSRTPRTTRSCSRASRTSPTRACCRR